MKQIIVLPFLVLTLTTTVYANSEGHVEEKNQLEHKTENKKGHKSNSGHSEGLRDYLKAKNTCLEKNKELKGKHLRDCIINEQKEAK